MLSYFGLVPAALIGVNLSELLGRAEEVLGWVQSGELKLHIGLTLPLSEAVEAHRQLEGRETVGKILLTP